MLQQNIELSLKNAGQQAWKRHTKSIVVPSPQTCVEDLVYCIRTNPKKLEKRIKRLRFCLKSFSNLPVELRERAESTISEFEPQIVNNDNGINEEYFRQLHSIEEFFLTSSTTSVPFFIESDLDPANALFNDELKKSVNADGNVYKTFAYVAVIALSLMKSIVDKSHQDYETKQAVKDMKIVFKGGASMGHFLLREPTIWNSLSSDEQEYVNSSFIKGGDNDTSLSFEQNVSDELRRTLLHSYMEIVANMMEVFRVDRLVKKYIRQTERNSIVCFGDEFFIQASKRRSYDIVDYAEGIKTLSFRRDVQKQNLYFTHSHCSFDTRDGRSDFYLSRVKAAFQVYSADSMTRWNKKISCNAECLDVSVATSKDVRPFMAVYTHARFLA